MGIRIFARVSSRFPLLDFLLRDCPFGSSTSAHPKLCKGSRLASLLIARSQQSRLWRFTQLELG
jgi:hypothetical protein